MPNKELLDKENKTILEILKTIQQYGMGALSKKEMTELIEADKTNWGDNIDEFIKEQEAITSGEVDGEYLSGEQRKAIVRKRRMNVSKFLGKDQTTETAADTTGTGSLSVRKQTIDPAKLVSTPAPEKTQESLAIVVRGIDSIIETLKAEKKQDKKHFSFLRKMVETFKRRRDENKLEFKIFDGLKKTATTLLAPFKSAWSEFIDFIGKVLLGRVLFKILEWMGNKENQGKLQSIIKFFKDWWPTLLAGYLLFGTGFTSMAVGLVKVVAFGTVKLLALIPKLMAALAKLKLGKLLKMIPGGGMLKGALLLGGGVAATYGIGKMLNKDKEAENLAAAQNQSTEKLTEEGMDPGEAATTSQSVVTGDSNRMTDTNMRSNNNMLQTGMNDPLGGGFNKFAQGGFVSGPAGVDKVPARLTAGEFVMSKGAVQKYGTNTLAAMNAAGGGTNRPTPMGGYFGGGEVKSYKELLEKGGSVEDNNYGNIREIKVLFPVKKSGLFGRRRTRRTNDFLIQDRSQMNIPIEDFINMKLFDGVPKAKAENTSISSGLGVGAVKDMVNMEGYKKPDIKPSEKKKVTIDGGLVQMGRGAAKRRMEESKPTPIEKKKVTADGGRVQMGRGAAKRKMEASKITPIKKKKVTVAYEEEKGNMADRPTNKKSEQEIPSFNVTAMRSAQKIKVLGISV